MWGLDCVQFACSIDLRDHSTHGQVALLSGADVSKPYTYSIVFRNHFPSSIALITTLSISCISFNLWVQRRGRSLWLVINVLLNNCVEFKFVSTKCDQQNDKKGDLAKSEIYQVITLLIFCNHHSLLNVYVI